MRYADDFAVQVQSLSKFLGTLRKMKFLLIVAIMLSFNAELQMKELEMVKLSDVKECEYCSCYAMGLVMTVMAVFAVSIAAVLLLVLSCYHCFKADKSKEIVMFAAGKRIMLSTFICFQ